MTNTTKCDIIIIPKGKKGKYKMKKTSERKWIIFFDGKDTIVTDKGEFYEGMNGVIVPISADVAADALMLILSKGAEPIIRTED